TSRYHEVAQDYEQLVKDDPLDIQALAGLVASYSQYDVNIAEKYEAEIDVESLEKVVSGVKKSYIKKADTKTIEKQTKTTPKKKKKRKPLLPKNYNPDVPSDPERWLLKPINERSQSVAVAGGGIGGTGSANIARKSNVTSTETVVTSKPEPPVSTPKPKVGGDKKKKGGSKL
ncbi:2116_t:CDS:2, partial [Scutellospora calospora]